MSTKQQIILSGAPPGYFREGQSQRQIARELHIGRRTVKKYIAAYSQSQISVQGQAEALDAPLIEELVVAPTYDSSNRGKRRLTEGLVARLMPFSKRMRISGRQDFISK